jgi:hypothetical protein
MWMTTKAGLCLSCVLAFAVPVAAAEPSSASSTSFGQQAMTAAQKHAAANLLDTMLRSGHADPSQFSPSFLRQMPVSAVDAAIRQLTSSLGAYRLVYFNGTNFVAVFYSGKAGIADFHLDADNKIDALQFAPAVALDDGQAQGIFKPNQGSNLQPQTAAVQNTSNQVVRGH